MLRMQVNQMELKNVVGNVKKLEKGMAMRVGQAINLSALRIESSAKKNVPVDTGNLRSSIMTQKNSSYSRTVGTNSEYAPYVEFGTRSKVDTIISGVDYSSVAEPFKKSDGGPGGMSPRPYLFPAFEKEKPRLISNIKKILKSG